MKRVNFIVRKKFPFAKIAISLGAFISLAAIIHQFATQEPTVIVVKSESLPVVVLQSKPKVAVETDLYAEIEKRLQVGDIAGFESVVRENNSKSLAITLDSDVFFQFGTAKLEKKSLDGIQQLISILKPVESMSMVEIEGHTDISPVVRQKVNYPSNWELSAARAASLVPLFSQNGFYQNQLKVIGYGDSRPKYSEPTTHQFSAKNRRIVLRISREENVTL
jgi:flagellar motor protein MotB